MKLKIGQHLFTRDGRVRGNAVIIAIRKTKLGLRYDFQTDFGNVGRELNIQEITESFYTENSHGEVQISDLDRWNYDQNTHRGDALKCHAFSTAVTILNDAFKADPAAIHALICNRVPCNSALADHPTIQVGFDPTALPSYNVGMLGIINGLIEAITSKRIAVMFSDEDPVTKKSIVIGFCEYVQPADKA